MKSQPGVVDNVGNAVADEAATCLSAGRRYRPGTSLTFNGCDSPVERGVSRALISVFLYGTI
jgi:hypothetical protein